jgi:outer membrane protein assembly factor BamB
MMGRGNRFPPAVAATFVVVASLGLARTSQGDDWPQFRGPYTDNTVTGFTVPSTWPASLKEKWKVPVGDGLAAPALVGDKIYTFTRQGGEEVTLCLEAATGKEVWKDSYAAEAVGGAAARFPVRGPRSSPAVRDGKVCTFGVSGVLSCLDAGSGKVVWRKTTKGRPTFYTSQSPVITEGLCILHVGGPEGPRGKGELTAYELATGEVKWKWAGDAPSYGSPVVATLADTKQVVVLTSANLIGVALADGKLLWSTPLNQGRYQTATPIVMGNTVICTGVAFTIEKSGATFTTRQAWKGQAPHQYNTPVLKEGILYGLMGTGRTSTIYAQDATSGKVLWEDPVNRGEGGSILNAGSVLIGLGTDLNLVVFKPDKQEFKEVAKYKVGEGPAWAGPILAGKHIYIKDKDSLILWSLE